MPPEAKSRGGRAGLTGLLFGLAVSLAGCASVARAPAPPPDAGAARASTYLGIPYARFVPDEQPDVVRESWFAAEARRRVATGGRPGTAHMLALSGGGGDGAYGAGVLVGWSARGDRPEFELVTGVSTGALMAPFAFLGERHDATLRQLYTGTTDADIAVPRSLAAALGSDALADTGPLARLIDRLLTDEMVAAIAAEHHKGRILLIGTTNLDLSRPVVWNIGVVAASGHPQARSLIAQVLLASAAIPGVFPPVMLPSTVPGRAEMHVDGGVSNQLFLYSPRNSLAEAPPEVRQRRRIAWVIRNGRFAGSAADTERSLVPIATRSIAALIAANALGDTFRTYLAARRDGIGYHLTSIPAEFTREPRSAFDQAYMQELFALGEARMRAGSAWIDRPPGYATR